MAEEVMAFFNKYFMVQTRFSFADLGKEQAAQSGRVLDGAILRLVEITAEVDPVTAGLITALTVAALAGLRFRLRIAPCQDEMCFWEEMHSEVSWWN